MRCPFCTNRRLSITNCLATVAPKLAREWHPTKNRTLTPAKVIAGSKRMVWWKCAKGDDHVWRASLTLRLRAGTGCPFCAGHRASKTNALSTKAPHLAREWHPTRNRRLAPSAVIATSPRTVWWRCSKNPKHEWQARVLHRFNGVGCPFCAGRKPRVHAARPATRRFSLARLRPALAREWHESKNGALTPKDVSAGSAKRVWWRCHGARHEWIMAISDRARGAGCPYCSGQRVSKENSLAAIAPRAAREWHQSKNGDVRPKDVVAGSNKKAWWRCAHGHVWETAIRNRAIVGTGCPKCWRERRVRLVDRSRSRL